MLMPPGGLTLPPRRNPGSATGINYITVKKYHEFDSSRPCMKNIDLDGILTH